MSTRVSAANLNQSVKDILLQWQNTQSFWRDVKSREFEHRFMEHLPDLVMKAKTVIEEIDIILRKARKDCE